MTIKRLALRPSNLQIWLQDDSQERPFRLITVQNGLIFFLIVSLTIWAAWQRGPWLDEFWTLWLSKHDLPLAATVRDRWLIDVHPPLFVALNWLAQPLIGDSVLTRRLVNLIPLCIAALFVIAICRKYPWSKNFTTVFTFLAITSPVVAYNITEIRSYFTQICCVISLIVCLHSILMMEKVGRIRDHRVLAVSVCILILLCLNIHYVTAVVATSIVATAGLGMLVRRQRNWFQLLLTAGVFASAPLLVWFIAQNSFLERISGTFWLIVSLPTAVKILIGLIGKSFCFNLVVIVILIMSTSKYFSIRGHKRSSLSRNEIEFGHFGANADREIFIIAMISGLALASLILLLINVYRPQIFVARYLSSIAVTTVAIVAAVIADTVCRHRRIFNIFLLNGALVYSVTVISHGLDQGWDGAASFIRSQFNECGSSEILAVEYKASYFVPNLDRVIDWAYQQEAQRFGFPLKVLPSGSKLDLSRSGRCQSMLWIDHVIWSELPEPATAGDIAKKIDITIPPSFLRQARLVFSGSGVVIVMGPSPADM
ncbi:hypothetical protein MKK69_27270 [Methylobacterium sp. J-026]|uniref:hypothetical protein n=1 Tax=Methylobacterium sp. J-026 TaxID=2836624 RepID=UPI001FBBE212|nr:hypothetical protein [Methylobacterium sp. J-026]MCJ2137703.1 hypothetical protein [Methylobacterium sp. J-026]